MRVVKLTLSGIVVVLALAAGLVATVFAAFVALTIHFFRSFARRAPTAPSTAPAASPRPPRTAPAGDAIDIVATEVPGDPPRR